MENCRRQSASQNVFLPTVISLLLPMLSIAGVTPARAQATPQSQSAPPAQSSSQAQTQAPPQDDSLADAARKARANKAKSAPPRVFTDDDVSGSRGGGGVSVVGQASAAGASSGKGNGDSKRQTNTSAKIEKNDEEFWRSKARKLLDQIAEVGLEIDKLKEDIRKNGSSGFDAASGLRKNEIYVDDKNARLQELEKQKEDLQKQLDQLAEDGRKAGAPAGWFR